MYEYICIAKYGLSLSSMQAEKFKMRVNVGMMLIVQR